MRRHVTVEQEPLDLVLEGRVVKVRDGAFHDTEGAPTAGPPPCDVYEVAPTAAFGFGADETFVPTRWRFGEPTT